MTNGPTWCRRWYRYWGFNWVNTDKFSEMCRRCEQETVEDNNSGARKWAGLVLSISPQAFWSFMWTCRNGSCVSSVIYFCFIVLQTGVKTTTTYHKIPTNESDLFVFLEFSLWTCPGRIYGVLPPSLWEWAWLICHLHARLLLIPSLTLIPAQRPSISSSTRSRKKWIPPPLLVLVVSQTLSVKLGLEFCENSLAVSVTLSAISIFALAAPLFLFSCPLTVMICSPNPISFCINPCFGVLLSRLFAFELISLSHSKKICRNIHIFTVTR